MSQEKVKNKGRGQIFNNPILEAFTRTGLKLNIALHAILISAFIIVNIRFEIVTPWYKAALLFLAGVAFWTLMEYVLHRFVFHWVNESKFSQKFHYMLHGVHHEYPKDEERVFMPPLPTLIFLALFGGVYYLIMGNNAFMFLPGFELGYFLYSFIHYGIHKRKAPKGMKKLWQHHTLHHYKHPELAFGVSSFFWDKVFGTMPPERKTGERTHRA